MRLRICVTEIRNRDESKCSVLHMKPLNRAGPWRRPRGPTPPCSDVDIPPIKPQLQNVFVQNGHASVAQHIFITRVLFSTRRNRTRGCSHHRTPAAAVNGAKETESGEVEAAQDTSMTVVNSGHHKHEYG